MSYFVKKITWEYGEAYGHVFYPKDLSDFQGKLRDLDAEASARENPFYVEISFLDGSYLGLIVGHALSCFVFGGIIYNDGGSNDYRRKYDVHYDEQKECDDTFIQYSYLADHGEKRLTEMLPKEQAFEALYQYITRQKLPPYIRLSCQKLIDKYIG